MLLILPLCTIFTSLISGVTGMGGGVLLVSIMAVFVPYNILIPIHGIVQLVSNSSRSFYLRKSIRMDFFIPFLLGTPFGFIIAYFILKEISNPNIFYLILSIFILYSVFKPKHFPEMRLNKFQWGILGLFSGIQGSLVGATGPLIAPFYLRSDIKKEEIVATKAAQQIVTHFLKIPLFLSLSFNYILHIELIIYMCLGAILGTYLGIKLLHRVDEGFFKTLFKTVLFIAAARLLYKFGVTV